MNTGTSRSQIRIRHIHILGAAGSGTTTLAKKLSEDLPHTHIDTDDFFWETKYSEITPRDIRLNNLRNELYKHESWILSGAVIDWGNPLIPLFDVVVFISVSNEIRLERLFKREYARYGKAILPGGDRYEEYQKFIKWAKLYETGGMDVRSRLQQETWLEDLPCPVLRIDGDKSVSINSRLLLENIIE